MTDEATKLIAREPGIEMIEAGMREAYRASSLRTIWEAMYDAAHDLSQAPAAEAPTCVYRSGCTTPAYCAAQQRCTAKDAAPSPAPAAEPTFTCLQAVQGHARCASPCGSGMCAFNPDEPDTIAEHLRGMLASGTMTCPLCGRDNPHEHSPTEIIIYRNGVKYGRSLGENR